jgi:hypothetical protein
MALLPSSEFQELFLFLAEIPPAHGKRTATPI